MKVLPTVKYDSTSQRDWTAFATGIVLVVASLIMQMATTFPISQNAFFIITLPFRIGAAVWVYKIMGRLNRDQGWSAFVAFLLPALVLIISGVLRKKYLRFEIDQNQTKETQLNALREYAKGFLSRGKYDEAAFVYRYMIDNLPVTQEDLEKYEVFKGNHNIFIPEYIAVGS